MRCASAAEAGRGARPGMVWRPMGTSCVAPRGRSGVGHPAEQQLRPKQSRANGTRSGTGAEGAGRSGSWAAGPRTMTTRKWAC